MTMPHPDRPLRVASQLGERVDALIRRQMAGLPVEIVSIGRDIHEAIPEGTSVLIVWPFENNETYNEPPPGWPHQLQWVQLASAGIETYPPWIFDVPIVSNGSGALADPIAEFCIALIFAAAKRLPETWAHGPGEWHSRKLGAVEGANLGIFGFGAIGQSVARKALAVGMSVHASRKSDRSMPAGVTRVENIRELAAISDHLIVSAPATPETYRIVSAEVLAHAKPGLHLINVARGSLIDDDALLAALDSGQVALASLDVADPEPLPEAHPFYTHPRIRLSPHTSAFVPDMSDRMAGFMSENLRRYLAGEPINSIVARAHATTGG